FVDESENDDTDEILDVGGLKRFVELERFGNDNGGGGSGGQFNISIAF
ncbi:unnamed protein product, partial [Rotaria sp. Silwood1]